MLKKLLVVLGIVFILVGILGFINNPILGMFHVNLLHNIIHLASGGLALFFAGQSESAGKKFALAFGAVYGLVAVLGFVAPSLMMSLLAIDTLDNFLHIALALVFIVLGSVKLGGDLAQQARAS
jgi:hypothetical protein